MKIKKADFVKSAVYEKDYPEQLDKMEFAFVGRSNVGKSSLINSLASRLKLARTSKTPGRTQLINYFLINDEFYIVDLPGYGFAKVPKEMKKQWGQTMERYIASKRKKLVFVLLDIRRVPSDEDIEMLELAGYSFAMENGEEKVKRMAKYIAPSNDEAGVLQVLEQYLKER